MTCFGGMVGRGDTSLSDDFNFFTGLTPGVATGMNKHWNQITECFSHTLTVSWIGRTPGEFWIGGTPREFWIGGTPGEFCMGYKNVQHIKIWVTSVHVCLAVHIALSIEVQLVHEIIQIPYFNFS